MAKTLKINVSPDIRATVLEGKWLHTELPLGKVEPHSKHPWAKSFIDEWAEGKGIKNPAKQGCLHNLTFIQLDTSNKANFCDLHHKELVQELYSKAVKLLLKVD